MHRRVVTNLFHPPTLSSTPNPSDETACGRGGRPCRGYPPTLLPDQTGSPPSVTTSPVSPSGRTPKVKNVFCFKLDAKSVPEALATTILILLMLSIVLTHRCNPGASAHPAPSDTPHPHPIGTPSAPHRHPATFMGRDLKPENPPATFYGGGLPASFPAPIPATFVATFF